MKITFLGTGTSLGVPQIGCKCPVCTSSDPRDSRSRPSALVEIEGCRILIDASPDFRTQLLAHNIDALDAILITHAHADHILGLNDLTALSKNMNSPIRIFLSEESLSIVRKVFFYAFDSAPGVSSKPSFDISIFSDSPFHVCGVEIIPIQVIHSDMLVHGFRFDNFAYITDAKSIPEHSYDLLSGVKTLVVNSLRYSIQHPSHFSVLEALQAIDRIAPQKAFLTHIGHSISHAYHSNLLPKNVEFAYDGLTVELSHKSSVEN